MDTRKYIDPEEAARGRAQADADWSAGTVQTDQDVCQRNHSSYGLAYITRIDELKAEHSYRVPKS